MSWQKQTEEMISGWTATQRRLWDNWMEAIKGVAPGAEQWQQEYHKHLDQWENAVREALSRQQELAGSWKLPLADDAAGREAAEEWMTRAQEMMRTWTETQMKLWEGWVQSMSRIEGGVPDPAWQEHASKVMNAWQEAAQHAQEALTQWSQTAAAQGGIGGAGSGGGGSGSAGGGGQKGRRTSGGRSGGSRSGGSGSGSGGAGKS